MLQAPSALKNCALPDGSIVFNTLHGNVLCTVCIFNVSLAGMFYVQYVYPMFLLCASKVS